MMSICVGRRKRRGDGPAGEGVGALEVELVALLDEALAVAPFVHAILEMRVKDLHRCERRQPTDIACTNASVLTIRDQNAAIWVRRVRKLDYMREQPPKKSATTILTRTEFGCEWMPSTIIS